MKKTNVRNLQMIKQQGSFENICKSMAKFRVFFMFRIECLAGLSLYLMYNSLECHENFLRFQENSFDLHIPLFLFQESVIFPLF